jgi:hypothetical protein
MTHGQCNAVQHYKRSMTHGLYNRPNCCTTHGAWRMNYPWVMGCTIYREDVFPMDYGLYNTLFSYYFPMTHGPYNVTNSHDPWAMQHCTTKLGWVFSMSHGLYNSTNSPCPMERTTLLSSMPHGAYNTSLTHAPWGVQRFFHPCPMGRTTLLLLMPHGAYNTSLTHAPWVVQCFCSPYSIGKGHQNKW